MVGQRPPCNRRWSKFVYMLQVTAERRPAPRRCKYMYCYLYFMCLQEVCRGGMCICAGCNLQLIRALEPCENRVRADAALAICFRLCTAHIILFGTLSGGSMSAF